MWRLIFVIELKYKFVLMLLLPILYVLVCLDLQPVLLKQTLIWIVVIKVKTCNLRQMRLMSRRLKINDRDASVTWDASVLGDNFSDSCILLSFKLV